MINMCSKYDNMHKHIMFYTLICINNFIIACYQVLEEVSNPDPNATNNMQIIDENI